MHLQNVYDSHVHWLATGQVTMELNLSSLKSPDEIKNLSILPEHYRRDWLVGFGWDETFWSRPPHRKDLDLIFPDQPVAFSRVDGHAYWVNTLALKKAQIFDSAQKINASLSGGKIIMDKEGPTGMLVDTAKTYVDECIPPMNDFQVQGALLKGMKVFHQAGITHIRDLSCDESQWNEACHLEKSGLLQLAVEQFFSSEDPQFFSQALDLAVQAKKESSHLLRVQGVKVYFDGALGSEGAFLSQDYPSGSGRGLQLLSPKDLEEILLKTWEHNLDVAIHTIGDEAAHQVALVARRLWDQDHRGRLHLEHAQVVRPETLSLLQDQNVMAHFQPCHWLSDRRWLKEKLGDLYSYSFPWRAFQDCGIPFDFGSDTPIEPPDLKRTFQALKESAFQGIPKLLGPPEKFCIHPDLQWTSNTFTEFNESLENPEVTFEGQSLVS